MNEDYCSFEIAKLLKEKGFDVKLKYSLEKFDLKWTIQQN